MLGLVLPQLCSLSTKNKTPYLLYKIPFISLWKLTEQKFHHLHIFHSIQIIYRCIFISLLLQHPTLIGEILFPGEHNFIFNIPVTHVSKFMSFYFIKINKSFYCKHYLTQNWFFWHRNICLSIRHKTTFHFVLNDS